jgi:predicted permease
MIWALRIFFMLVLAAMLAVTTWASLRESILAIPPVVTGDPWFIATLFDAYFGFLTFFVWVAYKERTMVLRAVWLVAILLLGNMAMATYALVQLFRVPATATIRDVLLRREAA